MSYTRHNDTQGDLQAAVEPVLRVLSQLGGYFTFTDQQGEQFVIASKTEFDGRRVSEEKTERQLPLSSARRERDEADEVVEVINREIAFYQVKQDEELLDDLGLEEEETEAKLIDDGHVEHEYTVPTPPPVRVKFEPIRGDLPPELQE